MLLGLWVLISGCAALARLEPRPVNINEASRPRLEMLPGIGPAIAQRIIEGRPYSSVDELLNIKGIDGKLLKRIRPFVTVGETKLKSRGTYSKRKHIVEAPFGQNKEARGCRRFSLRGLEQVEFRMGLGVPDPQPAEAVSPRWAPHPGLKGPTEAAIHHQRRVPIAMPRRTGPTIPPRPIHPSTCEYGDTFLGDSRQDFGLADLLGVRYLGDVVGPLQWDYMRIKGDHPVVQGVPEERVMDDALEVTLYRGPEVLVVHLTNYQYSLRRPFRDVIPARDVRISR